MTNINHNVAYEYKSIRKYLWKLFGYLISENCEEIKDSNIQKRSIFYKQFHVVAIIYKFVKWDLVSLTLRLFEPVKSKSNYCVDINWTFDKNIT